MAPKKRDATGICSGYEPLQNLVIFVSAPSRWAKPMDNPEAETGAPLVKKPRKLTEDHDVMWNLEAVINSVQQDCEAMTSEDFMSAYLPSLSRLSNETNLDSDNEVSTPDLGSGATERDPLGTKKRKYQKRKSNSPKETFKQAEVTSNSTEGLGDVALVDTSADTFDAPAGVWVECVRCLKWRFLEDVKDPTELNEAWNCALQSKYADKEDLGAACEEPETTENIDETQYVYGEFATGSVVLAKMTGYPEWPSMIDCDAEGRFAEFCPKTGEVKSYRVVFLDPENRTTQLIPANRVRRFNNASVIRLEKRYGKYKRKLEAAIQEATKALELPVEERVYIYGYPYEKENALPSTFRSTVPLEHYHGFHVDLDIIRSREYAVVAHSLCL
ncbi:unnamed protein product [Dibothriocephalus latus]|uniref:CW-type domain-containing protein n=1 Tax=Dibothriocephalus latus TaxID=60516 RepID=A0A3P7KXM8_DIBLA|nr:unnamed protein product [Dibothriocephalus latus]